MLLQRLRRPAPSPEMYDMAHRVEECETQVIKVSNEIKAAQKAGRDATIKEIVDRETFGKAMADQQKLHKLLDTKGQVEDMEKTHAALEKVLKGRHEKVKT